MNIGDRIRYLRKEVLKCTQQTFSSRIDISRSNLGNIETGEVAVTERVISSICREFNVNEEWLRNGTGEMFKKLDREQEIADMTAMLFKEEDSSFKYRLVKALTSLDESGWEVLERLANEIANNKG